MTSPIDKDDMEWIIKTKSEGKKGVKALLITHITRQIGIKRLNDAFGLAWSDSYKDEMLRHEKEYGKNEVIDVFYTECTIEVQHDDGVFKTVRKGRASSADIDPEKSAESNAFKRAVSKFGFGLELYDYPKVYVECTGSGAGTKNYYPPTKKTMKSALDTIHGLVKSGKAEDEYFIDSKGGLYTFAYGWKDKKVSSGKTTVSKPVSKPTAKVEVKTNNTPIMGVFPTYVTGKENKVWDKAIEVWDGKIYKAKKGNYSFVELKHNKGDKSYHKLTKGQLEILSAHPKHKIS
jgi:hypothetical protein